MVMAPRLAGAKPLHGTNCFQPGRRRSKGFVAMLEYVAKWQGEDNGAYADAGDLLAAIQSAASSAEGLRMLEPRPS
jgi:hypothetical protein